MLTDAEIKKVVAMMIYWR